MNLEILKNLELIKSPNSETREGAYSRLVELFSVKKNAPTLEDKNQYLSMLCNKDFLFNEIDAGPSDHSVARSFSLLVMGIIIEGDKTNELDAEKIISPILKYIEQESDFRGKDEQLGWIHSLAHLGDLLAFLSFHKGISKKSIELISLAMIEKLASLNDLTLNHGEDKRLASGLFYAFEESLGSNTVILNSLRSGFNLNYPSKQNIDNLLRCLYIELITNGKDKNLADQVKLILMSHD